jgi:hypothetical protein
MGAEALKSRPWTTFHTAAADGHANASLVNSIRLSYLFALVIIIIVGSVGFAMYRDVHQVV